MWVSVLKSKHMWLRVVKMRGFTNVGVRSKRYKGHMLTNYIWVEVQYTTYRAHVEHMAGRN